MTYPVVHDRHVPVENARRKVVACLREVSEEYQLSLAEELYILGDELKALTITFLRMERKR